MRKYRTVNNKEKSLSKMLVYSLVVVLFSATVWYRNHSRSVLGVATGTEIDTGGVFIPPGESQPTIQSGQVTNTPTIVMQPTDMVVPTTIVLPTTAPTSPPIPTPVLVLPEDPVYVEIIDTPGDGSNGGGGQVDIGADPVTVVIENTPTGVTTTTEKLTPQTTLVHSSATVITSQTGQGAVVAQENVSTLDRLLSFFTGKSASVSTSAGTGFVQKNPVYSQIYTSSVNGATFVTNPTETVSALNEWLGFNGIKLESLGDGSFSITQGDVVAIITPKDNKIAVNLSRMELLVNTETGFQPLSYLPKRVTTYLADSGIISKLSAPIIVVETPTELQLQMQTTSTQYLAAFIPVSINVEYCMSATTLNPCGKKQGLLSKTLDFLSL